MGFIFIQYMYYYIKVLVFLKLYILIILCKHILKINT